MVGLLGRCPGTRAGWPLPLRLTGVGRLMVLTVVDRWRRLGMARAGRGRLAIGVRRTTRVGRLMTLRLTGAERRIDLTGVGRRVRRAEALRLRLRLAALAAALLNLSNSPIGSPAYACAPGPLLTNRLIPDKAIGGSTPNINITHSGTAPTA